MGSMAAILLSGGTVYADDRDDIQALKEQLELQKKQMEQQAKLLDELQRKLGLVSEPAPKPHGDGAANELPPPRPVNTDAVREVVSDELKKRDEAKKRQEEADKEELATEGYKVGTDLGMNVRWNPFNGVTFETPHKDFTSHIGIRFQLDSVSWDQSPNTKPAGQVGDLEDGTFFRRIRPYWEGTAWEVVEYKVEPALEQVNNSVPDLDEVFAGVTQIPVIGSVRVGHIRVPQGLEGDLVSSSKSMTFLEKGAYTDAFYENFATGVWTSNSVLNQHMTWMAMAYRQDNDNNINAGNNGVSFQDGAYGYTPASRACPTMRTTGGA